MGNKTNEPILLYFDILQCTSAADLATSNFQCPTYAKCVNTCPDSYFSFFTHVLPAVTLGLNALATAPGNFFEDSKEPIHSQKSLVYCGLKKFFT